MMYRTGQIAKMAGVSIRTIRFYDSKGLLTPSAYNESGHRLYTDEDFQKLKRILALKYLGLSLEEILTLEQNEIDREGAIQTLAMQKRIIQNKINHLHTVFNAIEAAEASVIEGGGLSWNETVDIIKILKNERELRQKFIDASSLSAEINLFHQQKAESNWYNWVFDNMSFKKTDKVLDLGGGDGALWYKNVNKLDSPPDVTLTEVTHDLLTLAKGNVTPHFQGFHYEVVPMESLPYPDETFDVVIANHILFYLKDVDTTLCEIERILKKGGFIYTSTIGQKHMDELERLIKSYDSTIKLGKTEQLKNFGFDVAKDKLMKRFSDVTYYTHENQLVVEDPASLLRYIYSIPGAMLDIAEGKKKEFGAHIKQALVRRGCTIQSIQSKHFIHW